MSINTQKLLDEIERRYAALDSTSSLSEIQRVSELNARKDAPILTGAIQYGSLNQANAPSGMGDSAKVGEIFFVADQQLDSNGRFYFRSQDGFINLKTALDSSENASITSAATPTPAEPSGFSVASINGSASGYRQGGLTPYVNRIDKYSYTSDGNATDVGDLVSAFAYTASSSTNDYGYSHGGYPNAAEQKYSHTSDGNATAIPNLATSAYWSAGHTSDTNIYMSMFYNALTPTIGSPNWNDDIGKAPIASEDAWSAVSTTWSNTIGGSTGQMAQSYTDAYAAGGLSSWPQPAATAYNVIEKFPFASEGTTTDVGDLSTVRGEQSHNSYENNYGYSAGGRTASPAAKTNVIEKYPFASSGNAADVGDLLGSTDMMGATNSTTSGYAHGGIPSQNVIQKFSFTSDGNATDVGDLLDSKYNAGGSQV